MSNVESIRFLYMTVIALDANFRLRRRAISNEERDPAMISGWDYFVEDKPYREYLLKRLKNDEVMPSLVIYTPPLTNAKLPDQYMYGVRRVDVCKQ